MGLRRWRSKKKNAFLIYSLSKFSFLEKISMSSRSVGPWGASPTMKNASSAAEMIMVFLRLSRAAQLQNRYEEQLAPILSEVTAWAFATR